MAGIKGTYTSFYNLLLSLLKLLIFKEIARHVSIIRFIDFVCLNKREKRFKKSVMY